MPCHLGLGRARRVCQEAGKNIRSARGVPDSFRSKGRVSVRERTLGPLKMPTDVCPNRPQPRPKCPCGGALSGADFVRTGTRHAPQISFLGRHIKIARSAGR
jgi:hypothetical protein